MNKFISNKQMKHNRRRRFTDMRFRAYGVIGLLAAGSALLGLLGGIFSTGYDAFRQTAVTLDFSLDINTLGISNTPSDEELQDANVTKVVKQSLYQLFPDVSKSRDKRKLKKLLSPGAEWDLRDYLLANKSAIGSTISLTVPMASDADQYYKAILRGEDLRGKNKKSRLSDKQQQWFHDLLEKNRVELRFNSGFFLSADSRYPELAGIGGAIIGSFYALLICLLIAFPLGVGAAIYLEEFSGDSAITRAIEVNINNLAAVPSIIFGLLGLAIILNVFGLVHL
jgi:phosphate transport system permease protein